MNPGPGVPDGLEEVVVFWVAWFSIGGSIGGSTRAVMCVSGITAEIEEYNDGEGDNTCVG